MLARRRLMAHHIQDVARLPISELGHLLRYGETPDFSRFDGWLFKGANVTFPGRLLFPKFVKGFFTEKGTPAGYNIDCQRSGLDDPNWLLVPSQDRPKAYGFFGCRVVHAGEAAAMHPGSLFLDYARGGNGLSPTRFLRDYLVQVEGGNKDLFLGKAYLDVGPWLYAGYFVLERWAKAPGPPPR